MTRNFVAPATISRNGVYASIAKGSKTARPIRSKLLFVLFNALVTISCFSAFQTPANAAILNVPSTQYPTIQSAINAANRGDTIIVEAGRTYTENLVLKYKSSGSGYITIQSSALASLPAPGNRVSPADAPNMPLIRSTSTGSTSVFRTEVVNGNPSHHYKLVGLEITRPTTNTQMTALISLGSSGSEQDSLSEVPHNFIIDRCYIHGTSTANTRRGISLQSRDTEIVDSYISDIHEAGADSQAICGWNGPGNYLIKNNFLEGGAENIMFGGGDPSISGLVPTGIRIENNYFFKPLSWRNRNPSWVPKNLLELKNAKQVVIENNIFENSWAEGQAGYGIVLTVRNQDGSAQWSTIEDVTFRYNIVKNVGSAMQVLTADYSYPSQNMENLDVNNNLFLVNGNSMGGGGLGVCLTGVSGNAGQNISFTNNTFIHASGGNRFFECAATRVATNLTIKDNIQAGSGTVEQIGLLSNGDQTGNAYLNLAAGSTWNFQKNVLQMASQAHRSLHPTSSTYVSNIGNFGFVNVSAGNYELAPTSAYKGAGSNGIDPGADIKGINRRTACTQTGQQSACNNGAVRADFDGDGRSDISVFRAADATWYLNQSSTGQNSVRFGLATDKVVPADFDGDGKTDVAVFRPEQKIWYILQSSNGALSVQYFGNSSDVPLPADFDGDGKDDVAVWRPTNGTWYRLNSSNGGYSAAQFGMAGDKPVLGDFDGDGVADLGVFRPLTGIWYLQKSSEGFSATQFGISTDKVTPSDFDGDGRTDIAVFRPSNGTWYRLESSSGQFVSMKFGIVEDIPSPGDFDGDGKADVAVFRPSSGIWYMQGSSAGFSAVQYGLGSDLPLLAAFLGN